MEMHLLQKHILKKLTENKKLRYADLKPPRVEGNQFTYHLKTLTRQGLIAHSGPHYSLTTKGVHYATGVSFEHFFVRAQPKIVTLIVCKNDKDQYLLYTRNKQPFLGKVGFPYGKVHLGENVQEAAERELKEKTGYSSSLTHKGIMYLLVTDKEGEVIAHQMSHVFSAGKLKGEALENPLFGKIHWSSEKQLLTEELMPGVPEVLAMTKKKSGIVFQELSFQQT